MEKLVRGSSIKVVVCIVAMFVVLGFSSTKVFAQEAVNDPGAAQELIMPDSGDPDVVFEAAQQALVDQQNDLENNSGIVLAVIPDTTGDLEEELEEILEEDDETEEEPNNLDLLDDEFGDEEELSFDERDFENGIWPDCADDRDVDGTVDWLDDDADGDGVLDFDRDGDGIPDRLDDHWDGEEAPENPDYLA